MKILIADDYPVARLVIERAVSSIPGVELDFVGNGIEALRCYKSRCHDVIILDQNMPSMSGTDFLRQIAEHPALPRTHVVMVTGSADSQLIAIIRRDRLKVDDLVAKPFDVKILSRKIGQFATRFSSERRSQPAAATRPKAAAEDVSPTTPIRPFSYTLINRGTVAILELRGAFVQGNWNTMNTAAKEAQAVHAPEILVDVSELDAIDDTGVGLLLVLNGLLAAAHRTCSLSFGSCPLQERLRELGVSNLMPERPRPPARFQACSDLQKFQQVRADDCRSAEKYPWCVGPPG